MEIGKRGLNKEEKGKKDSYCYYFDNIDHFPTYEEISKYFGISVKQVEMDISYFGLKHYYHKLPIYIAIRKRKPIYEEKYFNTDTPLSVFELCDLLHIDEKTFLSDLRYLREKYGLKKNSILSKDNQSLTRKEIERAKNRNNLYLAAIDSFNGEIDYNRISKRIYIPVKEVRKDLKILGIVTDSIKNNHQFFEVRKENYEKYFKEKGYKPYKKVVSKELGYSFETVREDFIKMGITDLDLQNDNYNKQNQEKALSHLDEYKKYYFESETVISLKELGKLLGLSKPTVIKEIKILKELFGEEIDKKAVDRRVKQEKLELEKQLKIEELKNKKVEEERLRDFVRENYFKSLYYMRGKQICEILNITKRKLNTIRGYILLNEDVFKRSHYWNKNLSKYVDVPFDIRVLSYREYQTKEGKIIDLKKLADDLRLERTVVYSDFLTKEVIDEFGNIDIPNEISHNFIYDRISKKDRLSMYKYYFENNDIYISYNHLSDILNISPNTIANDFREFNLHEVYDTNSLRKKQIRIVKHSERDIRIKERLSKYEEYFSEHSGIDSLRSLAQILGYSNSVVYKDFNSFNLYSIYHIVKHDKYEDRLEKYKKYFNINAFVDNIRSLAEELDLSYDTVLEDFRKNNLYTVFNVLSKRSRNNSEKEKRFELYNELLNENIPIFDLKQIARLLDINYRTVLKDFKDESLRKIYDLKKQDKKVIISIENKEYFLENYFNTDNPKTIVDMANELNLSNYKVGILLNLIKEELGLEKKSVSNLNKKRKNYYLDKYFYSDSPLSMEDMSKELNVTIQTIRKDIVYNLCKEDSELLKRHLEIKEQSIQNKKEREYWEMNLRKQYYLNNYFNSDNPMTIVEMSKELNIPEYKVSNELTSVSKELNIERPKQIPKRELRKEYYIENYFSAKVPKSPTILAAELGLSYDIVRRDLINLSREYNLKLRNVEEMEKSKRKQKDKVSIRNNFYLYNYFNSPLPKTIKEMANELGISEATVRKDLSEFCKKQEQ